MQHELYDFPQVDLFEAHRAEDRYDSIDYNVLVMVRDFGLRSLNGAAKFEANHLPICSPLTTVSAAREK